MQSEVIAVAGNKLTGEWHHKGNRKRLVVICHGYQGSAEDPTIVAIANGLNQKGHDTFTFNFSENTGGFDIEHQVRDIEEVLDYFKDYDELVLLAGSFAALTAAIATIKFPAVNRLITLNGFFGQGDLGENHRKTYIKFRIAATVIPKYRRILKYFRHELQPSLIKVPVLVIHSKVDRYVFIKQSRDFFQQLVCPKQFVELQDVNHGITSQAGRRKVVSEVHGWLKN